MDINSKDDIKVYKTTQSVFDKTESMLVNQRTSNEYIIDILKTWRHPIVFLLWGMKEMTMPILKMFAMIFLVFIITKFTSTHLPIPQEYMRLITYILLIIPIIITLFSLPSAYAFHGINNFSVDSVVKIIRNEKINTIDSIELLEKSFIVIFHSIRSRIKMFNYGVGAIWGGLVIYLNLDIRIWLKSVDGISRDKIWVALIQEYLPLLFVIVVLTLIILWVVLAYRHSNERVIKTIELACVQAKYKLNSTSRRLVLKNGKMVN